MTSQATQTPTDRTCLFCGISEAEVLHTQSKEGYTLGCGVESNTENGFDYEELSPRHRWKSWSDNEIQKLGVVPEKYDTYRRKTVFNIQYSPCLDQIRGHQYATGAPEDYGLEEGQCWSCGKKKDSQE